MDRNAGFVLLVAALAAPMAQAKEQQEKRPGFFRQLGGSLKDTRMWIAGFKPEGNRDGN